MRFSQGYKPSVTTAKVFKRAKKSLGITSRRAALGVVGGSGKCLGSNESSVERRPEPAPARRIPVSIGRGGSPASTMVNLPVTSRGIDDVSSRGIDGVSSWCTAEPFEFVRNLGSSEIWAWKADRLSWDAMVLFGCAPKPKRPARLFRQRRSRVGNQRREAHRAISRFGQSSTSQLTDPAKRGRGEIHFALGETGVSPGRVRGQPIGALRPAWKTDLGSSMSPCAWLVLNRSACRSDRGFEPALGPSSRNLAFAP
jgi:hypothetical protein